MCVALFLCKRYPSCLVADAFFFIHLLLSANARYKGSLYCRDCVCVVPNCQSPRYHGPCCSRHKKVLDACVAEVKMTFVSRASIAHLMPCDVVSFVLHAKPWRDNTVVKMLLALWKETCVLPLIICPSPLALSQGLQVLFII